MKTITLESKLTFLTNFELTGDFEVINEDVKIGGLSLILIKCNDYNELHLITK